MFLCCLKGIFSIISAYLASVIVTPILMKHTLLFIFFLFCSLQLGAQSAAFQGQSEDLRVFPNPVVNYFQIGYSDRVKRVQLVNTIGRKVRSFDYDNKAQYDISDLPRGFYLVQLLDSKNAVVQTQRISKY